MNPEFFAFLADRLGHEPSADAVEGFTPDEAMEWAWALNDILLPHRAAIADIPYDPAAEEECDRAIMAFALRPNAKTLAPLSLRGWRVLHDRHVAFLSIAAANKVAGTMTFIELPRGLPEEDRLGALMLVYYLRFPREHLRIGQEPH